MKGKILNDWKDLPRPFLWRRKFWWRHRVSTRPASATNQKQALISMKWDWEKSSHKSNHLEIMRTSLAIRKIIAANFPHWNCHSSAGKFWMEILQGARLKVRHKYAVRKSGKTKITSFFQAKIFQLKPIMFHGSYKCRIFSLLQINILIILQLLK